MGSPPVRSQRPRIILHIGRNKAGSTTLQDVCLRRRSHLLEEGIEYVLFGHLANSRVDVNGFQTFEALREYALAHRDRRILVSNEFMFGWPVAFTEAAAAVLRDCDVQVLAYVRRYDEWIVSAYAEETRKGMNMRDMGDYIAWMAPRISARPYLSKWRDCFGDQAVRVRDLDPGGLHGGGLISDFTHALGVPPLDATDVRSNAAPHWLELELVRKLAERNGDTEWAGVSHAEADPLLSELRPLLGEVAPVVYLDDRTRAELLALYAADLAWIEAPVASPADLASFRKREASASPRFEDAPAGVLKAFFKRVSKPGFVMHHPQASARAARLAAELGQATSR